ncbi:MAG: DUF3291 domain-containing protein, partial [Leptolyngbya sp. SIO1D8]|nr:DUF3291 domain-containing protein [Leptolyngbya sp. SIO1D8]
AHQALWWVPVGHEPTVEEALAKLAVLDRLGPGPAAFTLPWFRGDSPWNS